MVSDKLFPSYPLPDINTPVEAPSYAAVMDWMKATNGRHVTYDFWARGNYMRRLLYNRSNNIAPLLIQVENEKQMIWAYKRLALLGLPLEFVFAGQCNKGAVFHLCPWDLNVDSGWGYIAALGSKANINGRDYFPIIGHAKLMPEEIIDLIVDDLSEEFVNGSVFIAPAELIGLKSKALRTEIQKYSLLTGGMPILKDDVDIKSIIEIGIPFIDKLSIPDFRKLINDYGDHLVDFRSIFHKFSNARNIGEEEGYQVLRSLQMEIERLLKSDIHIPFRNIISVLGGVLCFGAATIAAASGDTSSVIAFAGAALGGINGACNIHQYLRERIQAKDKKIGASPYAMFWKLGLAKHDRAKTINRAFLGPPPKQSPSEFNDNVDYHWLCPPTSGMLFLAFEKA